MTYGYGPPNSQSSYLPPEVDFPEDQSKFQNLISQRERLTASILNVKENGQYEKSEILNAQQWFSTSQPTAAKTTRYSYRKVVDMVEINGGNIPAGLTTIPHGISLVTIPTRIYGTATVSGPKYLPLPYASATNNNIEINFDDSNINIDNNFGSPLTQCYITLEYLKT